MKKKNNQIDSFKDKICLVLALYTVGLLMWFAFFILRMLGRIRILHWERFPKNPKRLIVCSNHPSVLEVILLPFLFLRYFFWHPFQAIPWSTPDKQNYDRLIWKPFKPRLIFVNRRDKKEAQEAFHKMVRVLNLDMVVLLFPEGGRTGSAKKKEKHLYSEKGNKIRKLKPGIASLVLKTGASVFYIWVKDAEKVMPIVPNRLYTYPRFWDSSVILKFGKTVKFPKETDREEIIQSIATDILELADE